jgi:hypothetical protein
MSLADRLAPKQPTFANRLRVVTPKGWEPGVKFDSSSVQYVTTEAVGTLEGEPEWREAITAMGVTIPDGYRVRIAEMKFDPAAWTRDSDDQKLAVTKPVWRYRFIVEPAPVTSTSIDGIEILNALKRSPKTKRRMSGDGTLVLNLNDTQIGKDAGGGTDATIERVDNYFHLAAQRAKEVRNQVGDLVILLGGDLVEGCSIYPNQSFQIDRDRRAQIRTMTGIVLDMLDRFAPEFPTVRVLAVPGNHGEHRLQGKRVNRHDNDDQLVAEAAAMAAERDQKLSHVAFNIAYEEPAVTADIQGHILAVTHGSVYGKTGTGSPALKAYSWFKNMAAGRYPAGDASILVGNHFHHDVITNFGSLLFIQNPAMDGGSPEFADYSGTDCAPGMSTWLMTQQSRFTGYEVLR